MTYRKVLLSLMAIAMLETIPPAVLAQNPEEAVRVPQFGRLHGIVIDDQKQAVAGAIVTAQPEAEPGREMRPVFVASRKDGSFEFNGIPAGRYTLCAQIKERDLLNSCVWSENPRRITLAGGELLAGVPIVMRSGVPIEIELDDASNVLEATAAKQNRRRVLVGVFSGNGRFHPARVESREGKKVKHYILVPPNEDLKLLVHGRNVEIEDGAGKKIEPTAKATPFQAQKGQARTFRFQVKPKP